MPDVLSDPALLTALEQLRLQIMYESGRLEGGLDRDLNEITNVLARTQIGLDINQSNMNDIYASWYVDVQAVGFDALSVPLGNLESILQQIALTLSGFAGTADEVARKVSKPLLQPPGGADDPAGLNIGQAIARGEIKEVGSMLVAGSEDPLSLKVLMRNFLAWALGAGADIAKLYAVPLTEAIQIAREDQLGLRPGGPETAKDRMGRAYALASAAGLAAHGLAAALSVDVVANWDINATGLAAMVSTAAGFDELAAQVNRPLWAGYLGVPWQAYLNEKLRPYRPELETLLDWRRKRHEWANVPSGDIPPPLKQALQEKGLRDNDIISINNALWNEPNLRALTTLLENENATKDEPWLKEVIDRLGFDDRTSGYVLDALKNRQSGTYLRRLIDAWIDQVADGILDIGEFRERLGSVSLPDYVETVVSRVAEEKEYRQQVKEAIDEARLRYSRDETTFGEFRSDLESAGLESGRADSVASRDRLRRFHKVWLWSDLELARQALSTYRELFVTGLISLQGYRASLTAADVPLDLQASYENLDSRRRDLTIAHQVRTFNLPALRDNLVDGEIGLAGYERQLRLLSFPDSLLPAAMAYARVLARRAVVGRLERLQVPTAERAYVLGLITRSALRTLYGEANRTADEITLRLTLMDYLRSHDSGGAAAGGASSARAVAEAEWKYMNGEIEEPALVALYKRAGYAPDKVQKRLAILRPLRL